ncbi:hypothetical protein NIES2104_62100 [Leptolyngbya sp. NIES-2104]|nr:hypothetical protein NIES2104_62100 [Leptolyngbya sp. NIES-2104]
MQLFGCVSSDRFYERMGFIEPRRFGDCFVYRLNREGWHFNK